MTFSASDIAAIAQVIGAPDQSSDSTWFWNIKNTAQNRVMALTITTVTGAVDDETAGETAGEPAGKAPSQTVISVQTHQGYIELHSVTGFVLIEPDEVMFIAKQADKFSGLVVGKTCTCSQFANVSTALLRADFTTLDPSLLMAAMQLSIAEAILM